MLGFVEYSKLSMGHEKVQKVDGIFLHIQHLLRMLFLSAF